jgi:cellulose synthase/poly-beta-1,6-N-acetylglucosamine synthase-like glycosyltransferase
MSAWIFPAVIVALTVHYAYLLGSAAAGFHRASRSPGKSAELPPVSVVIPARNEEKAIRACLDSVLANDYPPFEVIVVDDRSTDRTAEIVKRYGPAVRLVPVTSHAEGLANKKRALASGVAVATGQVIVTTDADCTVPRSWMRTMLSYFEPDVGMVTGPVLYRASDTPTARLQTLEFLGLVALGGGLVEMGRPHLCNSANLAYRREAYFDVGGYDGLENISTGDDEMLMHRIAYESRWQVRSCMSPAAVVETDPTESLRSFIAQRKRWASAHARYPHVRLTATSILCYLFYLAIAAGAFVWTPAVAWSLAAALGVKIGAEAAVIVPAAMHFRRGRLAPLLLPAQLIYIPYILAIGIAGTFGGYTWKGRRIQR